MFRIVLADGSIREMPKVADAAVRSNSLICYDEAGSVVAQFEPRDVLAFGKDGVLLELAKSGEFAAEDQERQTA